jgi:hypothetical protein
MTASLAEYRLDELRIDTTAQLGEGGAADVHRCKTADGKRMVFKRYNEEAIEKLDGETLRNVVAWPANLPEDARKHLMAMSAWPQAVVANGDSVLGVLMAEAPARFFRTRDGRSVPRHFSLVAVRKEPAERRGYPYYDFPHKIARLGHLLSELQFLHSHDIVIGDLQNNNILTTSPEADATGMVTAENYLLDCDSFLVNGHSALPPMDPFNARPPYPVDGHSATTDLFKFALLVIRCLSEYLGAEKLEYELFSHILPSVDFVKLEKLLTLPDPGLTAMDLASMAKAWQTTVSKNGRLFCRNDAALREAWTEEKRQKHLAGLEAAAEGSSAAASTPSPSELNRATAPASLIGKREEEEKKDEGEGKEDRPKPKRRKWIIAAALFILAVVAGVIAVVVNQKHNNSSSSSYSSSASSSYTTTTTYYTTPTYSTTTAPSLPPLSPSGVVMRNARIGDCLHVVEGTATPSGTNAIVSVDKATCGTAYATDRVTKLTNDPANCPNRNWLRDTERYPTVVLCTG